MTIRKALRQAVKAAGGFTQVADQIGVTKSAVHQWVEAGSIPPLRVLTFERVTGFPRWKARPDIYPKEG